jgi:hypothetical protein
MKRFLRRAYLLITLPLYTIAVISVIAMECVLGEQTPADVFVEATNIFQEYWEA